MKPSAALVIAAALLGTTEGATQPAKKTPAPRGGATLRPLLVVTSQAGKRDAFVLACARGTSIIAGRACAAQLGKALTTLGLETGESTKQAMKGAAVRYGWPCPGPREIVKKPQQPYVRLDCELEPASIVVAAGTPLLAVDAADAETRAGIKAAIDDAARALEVRAKTPNGRWLNEPEAIALVDLDGDQRHEIVLRFTEQYLLYSSDGKRLAGEVGCQYE